MILVPHPITILATLLVGLLHKGLSTKLSKPEKETKEFLSSNFLPPATSMKRAGLPPLIHRFSLSTPTRIHLRGTPCLQASDLWISGDLEEGKAKYCTS